ncbi:MAG: polyprenyl diphosphate synthase [Thermoleophilia bacterium]|jgi:undecaprenyl diphosphate synthase|nr:polyprenyl diphosphate synthase [Thermoleophilia bacterium]
MALFSRIRAARAALGSRPSAEAAGPGGAVPESVAIIMDGNGRWARRRHLPTAAGHRAGAKALRRVVRAAGDMGVRDLTVFSFSTENWSRPRDEVDDLMVLFSELIDREVPDLDAEGVSIRFIGRLDQLSSDLLAKIAEAEARTAHHARMRLFIAMNYGGRAEIVDAARRFAAEAGPDAGDEEFGRYMYAPEMRDPELIIRTSGEQRLSNFLLWQSAYAELVFSDALWPDFGPKDLEAAFAEYASRSRRFGKR